MERNYVRFLRKISYQDTTDRVMVFRNRQTLKNGLYVKNIREEFDNGTHNHIVRVFLGNSKNEAAEWKRIVNGKLVIEYDVERILI